jgi:NAD(P)-dependent dehydrogenase (short-subunit alcohol dehydrogenase family)
MNNHTLTPRLSDQYAEYSSIHRRFCMLRFEGRSALVTGASSGIGLATARRLAEEGARVICVARNAERLQAAIASLEHPEKHLALPLDVTDEKGLEAATATIKAEHAPLHIGAFCAGLHSMRPIQSVNSMRIDELMNANFKSALLCTKLFARCAAPDGASIVWLSSVAALVGNPMESVYAGAKGALLSACQSVAAELAPKKIRVNVLAPGVVETPMSASWMKYLSAEQINKIRDRHLLGFGRPEDVAGVIAFLASADAQWITGSCITVDGGFACH